MFDRFELLIREDKLDLIKNKKASGRPQDLLDIQKLKQKK